MPEKKVVSPKTTDFSPLILIVEQDDDTRLMLKYLLNIWRYRVIEATHTEEAERLAMESRPDLILLSVEWGIVDCLSNSRRMRELTAFDGTAIILISTPIEPEFRASALAVADDFLSKPIDFGYLEKVLKESLKNKGRQKTFSR